MQSDEETLFRAPCIDVHFIVRHAFRFVWMGRPLRKGGMQHFGGHVRPDPRFMIVPEHIRFDNGGIVTQDRHMPPSRR